MSAGADERASLRRLTALLAVSAILLFFDFGTRVFTTNDETRFPLLARDIVRHGHWLLPEIDGVPVLNKPPLHAWLIAIAAGPTRPLGPRLAQLPSLLAAPGPLALPHWICAPFFRPAGGLGARPIVVAAPRRLLPA